MSDEKKELSVEEKAKFAAEAEKAQAETTAIKARLNLEIAKAGAETRKLLAEAETAEQYAAEARIHLAQTERAEQDILQADRFHHVYYFTTEVSDRSAKDCMDSLSRWRRLGADRPKSEKKVEVVFNSPGGGVTAGMMLFDYIQEMKRDGWHVTVSTLGMAASMAGILLQAGTRRVMGAEAWILIHEISTGAVGKIGEIEDEVKFVKRIQERVLDIFAKRCADAKKKGTATKPLTKAALKKGWSRKDWWISSDEALAYGLCDEIR